jgi:hypothetical protein
MSWRGCRFQVGNDHFQIVTRLSFMVMIASYSTLQLEKHNEIKQPNVVKTPSAFLTLLRIFYIWTGQDLSGTEADFHFAQRVSDRRLFDVLCLLCQCCIGYHHSTEWQALVCMITVLLLLLSDANANKKIFIFNRSCVIIQNFHDHTLS